MWMSVPCTSHDVFVEERSLRGLAVHVAKRWHEYHLSDVAVRCTVQWAGHHWHHTTRLRKSDVGSYFQLFHEDYHDPVNWSFCYYWLHRGWNGPTSVDEMLRIIWGLALMQWHSSVGFPCPQVLDAECAGYGKDTVLLYVCDVLHSLICGTLRRARVLCMLARGFRRSVPCRGDHCMPGHSPAYAEDVACNTAKILLWSYGQELD
jgi:hypothetical protein